MCKFNSFIGVTHPPLAISLLSPPLSSNSVRSHTCLSLETCPEKHLGTWAAMSEEPEKGLWLLGQCCFCCSYPSLSHSSCLPRLDAGCPGLSLPTLGYIISCHPAPCPLVSGKYLLLFPQGDVSSLSLLLDPRLLDIDQGASPFPSLCF